MGSTQTEKMLPTLASNIQKPKQSKQNKCDISIGDAFSKWMDVKQSLKFSSHSAMAGFLLKVYESTLPIASVEFTKDKADIQNYVQKASQYQDFRMPKEILLEEYKKNFYPRSAFILYELSDETEDYKQGLIWQRPLCHAEKWCIEKVRRSIKPDTQYTLTWYASWTPCSYCVPAIIRFLRNYPKVKLRIFAARIYYHYIPRHKKGLRELHNNGVELHMMEWEDYQDFWEKYGDGQELRRSEIFKKKRNRAEVDWTTTLETILNEDDNNSNLDNAFRNMRL